MNIKHPLFKLETLNKNSIASYRTLLQEAPLCTFADGVSRRSIPASTSALILEQKVWKDLTQEALIVMKGLRSIVAQLQTPTFANLAQTIYRDLSAEERAIALKRDEHISASLRFDLFFDAQKLWILEINATIPAMYAYSDMIASAYAEAAGIQAPASNSRSLLNSLLFAYHRDGGRKEKGLSIAIVARDGDSQIAELQWHKRIWELDGNRVQIMTPDVYEANNAFDIVYRHIFATRCRPGSKFLDACLNYRQNHIYNPLSAHLEIKAMLALLSEAASPDADKNLPIIKGEIAKQVNHRVPWTRLLRPTLTTGILPTERRMPLIEYVAKNPERFVVKASSGYGGHHVFIGAESSEPRNVTTMTALSGSKTSVSWRQFIEWCAASETPTWIIQERIAGTKIRHSYVTESELVADRECFVDSSLFLSEGEPANTSWGGAVRFAADPIVNIGRGGGLVALFIK